MLLLVLIIIVIIFLIMKKIIEHYKPFDKNIGEVTSNVINIEPYRSYNKIPRDRYNICIVYQDSFMNADLNTRDEVGDAFFKWCNDYNKITTYYPQYRSAEIVFTKLKRVYDNFFSF
jgi:hypothetical protein